MIVKIKNGRIVLINDKGQVTRTYGLNIRTAILNYDESLILAIKGQDKLQLIDAHHGTVRRQIAVPRIVDARFDGDNIAITLDNGVIRIIRQNGQFIREIR